MNLCRATLLSCAVAVLVAGAASARPHDFTPPALKGTPQFLISGHGWGHGVGMSQYGAYGYAQHGFTFDKIVTHYFPGTKLDTTTVKSIRVVLVMQATVQKNWPAVEMNSTRLAQFFVSACRKIGYTPPPPAVTPPSFWTANRKARSRIQPPIAE